MTLANTFLQRQLLEVENPSGENLEEYYTTDAHINEALNAALRSYPLARLGIGTV